MENMNMNQNNQKSPLDTYGFDMTERARDRKYDPVIGRDREIRDAIMILSRKTKNNPVLIGKPGVGKSAIVEGLAERIVKGDVPQSLKNKKLYNIDISSIVAGAKFAGEFEERLKSVLDEVKKREGEIILFIDELHTIVGAGGNGGTIDAGNMLKPMLARGELHLIGATTFDEYKKYIETDKALERRFQQVMVDEPTVEDTISILRGIKDRYEMYHGVKIKDNAIIAAAELSNRYITSRFLPDKAIDLIDEACAMIKTELDSMPQELDDMRRKIMQMKIEELALKKEKDDKSKERLNILIKDIEEIDKIYNDKLKKWQDEKANVESLKILSEKIDNVKKDIEKAENEANLEKASKLKYQDLPELEKELDDKNKLLKNKELELLHNEVDVDEICKVISKWTGIPLSKLSSSEKEKILNLESDLKKRVYGQNEAIKKVADAIIRSKAGIKDPKKPIGSFLFLGPTGVGKTELCKTLAYNLFDDENMMVRIDMSEYMEKHSVSRLVGSPPGYVGYDEGGQLTEAVRRKPYSVILFDEVEKAHPDVFNILLQVLDDGRLTDSKGTTVDFKNTIIIFTSNIASEIILDNIDDKGNFKSDIEKLVRENLKNYFKPEFINRLDETIIFKPLDKNNIYAIIDLILSDLNNRLKDKNVHITLTDAAKSHILDNGFEANFGARPLKRYMQSTVENMVAKNIIEGKIPEGECTIDLKGDELYIK